MTPGEAAALLDLLGLAPEADSVTVLRAIERRAVERVCQKLEARACTLHAASEWFTDQLDVAHNAKISEAACRATIAFLRKEFCL